MKRWRDVVKSDLWERGINKGEWPDGTSNGAKAGVVSNVPPIDKRGATQSQLSRTGNKPSPMSGLQNNI